MSFGPMERATVRPTVALLLSDRRRNLGVQLVLLELRFRTFGLVTLRSTDLALSQPPASVPAEP